MRRTKVKTHKRRTRSGKIRTIKTYKRGGKRKARAYMPAKRKPESLFDMADGLMIFSLTPSQIARKNQEDRLKLEKSGDDPERLRNLKKEEIIRSQLDPLNFGSEPTRYTRPDGKFKKMTNPDKPGSKKSKFYGCVRSMRANKYGKDASIKICASIARRKK